MELNEFQALVFALIDVTRNADPTINLSDKIIAEHITRIEQLKPDLTKQEKADIIQEIKNKHGISCGVGSSMSENYTPWLHTRSIDWFYWDQYKISINNLPPAVIESIDTVTHNILDLVNDPQQEGQWDRRGMVVGHVQSGKTANYTGLITKAADTGYRVFIVIAGITNSLRQQTQTRIEEGFKDLILDHSKRPAFFTASDQDFNVNTARSVQLSLQAFTAPVVFVIKKNLHTLTSLIDWLEQSKGENSIDQLPMMLIDDEADNASLNTNQDLEEATTINTLIRKLLKAFQQKCYVGYTATPYANIFINDSPTAEIGESLFPKDFIYCLEAPSNYFGANKIFLGDDEKYILYINDHQETDREGLLPIKHGKRFQIENLPPSLLEAVDLFILATAIRQLRKKGTIHNTMLVNVSRFNSIQEQVTDKINEYLEKRKNALTFYKNKTLNTYKHLFQKEYAKIPENWSDIKNRLIEVIESIQIKLVNKDTDELSYSNVPAMPQKPITPKVFIAVGGLALSRGLTLEGLSVSYLIRSSLMYDTLMQMGRWFGYRDGYEELCKIYMTPILKSHYDSITHATNELFEEFQRMRIMKLTPSQFGLSVKKSPNSQLMITAKNKMWTGVETSSRVDFNGKYYETLELLAEQEKINKNRNMFLELLTKLGNCFTTSKGSYVWKNVPAQYVLDCISSYKKYGNLGEDALPRFISHMEEKDNIKEWDIALFSLQNENEKEGKKFVKIIDNIHIIPPTRTVTQYTEIGLIKVSQRKFASEGIEYLGLSPEELGNAMLNSQGKDVSDKACRYARKNPLLILFFTNMYDENKNIVQVEVPMYAISFPFIERNYDYEGEMYVVNQRYFKNILGIAASEDSNEVMDGDD